MKGHKKHFWERDDVETLMDMRDRLRKEWGEIATRFGVSVKSVQNKYRYVHALDESHRVTANKLTPELERSIDHLASARARQSPIDIILGNPPPGYSALDKQREGRA